MGKQISKPVSRILDKLLSGYRGTVTLVGVAGGAPLALCLLEHLGTKTIGRVVMVKPYISPQTVNALLVQPVQTPPILDVLYESARDCQRRDAAVRHAYPKGSSLILDSHVAVAGALYSSLLTNPSSGIGPSPSAFQAVDAELVDPNEIDSTGKAVWWSEWTFELNKNTKQPEAVVSDLNPWAGVDTTTQSPGASVTSSPSCFDRDSDEYSAQDMVDSDQHQWGGALILRGNRCVLVRSLETPPVWSGMRIPRLARREQEPGIECALRAAAETCDIDVDDDELELMPAVPPATLHLSETTRALIYPLYSTRPPPGALEDADVTDEEDSYDW